MNRQDFFEIGRIIKNHGIHGEVILEAKSPDLLKNIGESMAVEIDGLLVPFFISQIKQTSQERYRIKFDWIDSDQQTQKVINCPAFIKSTEIEINNDQLEENLQLLEGFTVTDINHGELGSINFVTSDINNPLMSITYKKQEILIPIHPDFIKSIDQHEKTMLIECPQGLIDIYFE